MEQLTEKLFKSFAKYIQQGIFDFSSLDEFRFYFVTKEGKTLFGITQWIHYLYANGLSFIALSKESDDEFVTQVAHEIYTWKFSGHEEKTIVAVQKKGIERCFYKEHQNIFRTVEVFIIDLAEQGCKEKTTGNLNLAEALVESENVCLYMDLDTVIYSAEDCAHKYKPYIHEANSLEAANGSVLHFSDSNRFFVTTEFSTAKTPKFVELLYGCRPGCFSQLTEDELEKICSYSQYDKNLVLEFVTKKFQTSVPACEVYKRVLKRKELLQNIPACVREAEKKIACENQTTGQMVKAKRKIMPIAIGVCACAFIVGLYALIRNPFAVGETYSTYSKIVSYNGHKDKVELPDFMKNVPTRTVGRRVFATKSLKQLSMPDTYYYINEQAFIKCKKLSQVQLSENLREIEDMAFQDCNISEISIPPTVYFLGDDVFRYNPLKKITIGKTLAEKYPQSLEAFVGDPDVELVYVDDSAAFSPENYFSLSDGGKTLYIEFFPLENLDIPSGTEEIKIGSNFNAESKFTSVSLPEGLKKIPSQMFIYSKIKEISLPDSLEEIPYGCFSDCNSLKKVHLGKNIKTIGSFAFAKSAIEEIEIPDGVEEIPDHCFSRCKLLKNVVLGSNVKKLLYYAFSESALENINLPDSLVDIDQSVFNHTNLSRVELPPKVKRIGDYAFMNCYALKKIRLNSELQIIGNSAFAGTDISKIKIPPKVEKISWSTFNNCNSLKTVYVEGKDTECKGFDYVNYDLVRLTKEENKN